MKKIVNPCICNVYNGRTNGFVKIEYKDNRLSIFGVIGPMSNGDCKGSSGQCIEGIRKGDPVEGWSREMLDKLCDIWDRWHLNDMRPYCAHQKELDWYKLASKKVTLYHYRLTSDALKLQKNAERSALEALRNGKTFTPNKEQTMFASMSYSLVSHQELSGYIAQYYEPKKSLYAGDSGSTEKKLLGWLTPEEHPDGILCRPCPVCGYKYGTAWKHEDVPQDVIEWLSSLPNTRVLPAWI